MAYRTDFPLPTPTAPASFGVNIHFIHWNLHQVAQIAAAGVKWVRIDFQWWRCETSPGVYDFSIYEQLFAELKKYNIRALLIMCYGNALYLSEAQKKLVEQTGASPHDFPPDTPAAQTAFINFSVAAVKKFKQQGHLWELWNEPNDGYFWKPAPDALAYAKLAVAWASAIRKVSYFEWLGGPALSTFDWAFIDTICRNGVLQYFDFFSVHAYRDTHPSTVIADWQKLRTIINSLKPSWKKVALVSGEWGYSELKFNPPVLPTEYQAIDSNGNVIQDSDVIASAAAVRKNILKATHELDSDAWGGYWIKPQMSRVEDPFGGKNAFRLESADRLEDPKYYSGIVQFGSATPGTWYTVSAWLRSTSGKLDITLGVDDWQTFGSGTRVVQIDEEWRRYTVTFQIKNPTHTLFQAHEHTKNNVAWEIAFPQTEVLSPPDQSTWDAYFKDRQADALLEMYKANIKAGVILSIWYDWQDTDSDSDNFHFRFGMLKDDETPKPVWSKLKNVSDVLSEWLPFTKL